jgi:hypothetical protein
MTLPPDEAALALKSCSGACRVCCASLSRCSAPTPDKRRTEETPLRLPRMGCAPATQTEPMEQFANGGRPRGFPLFPVFPLFLGYGAGWRAGYSTVISPDIACGP